MNLIAVPIEAMYFLMTPNTPLLYVILCLIQNMISVGYNLSYANILYMNLPNEDSTAYISFYAVGANVCALAGMVFGTWLVSRRADVPLSMLGRDVYMVQFANLIKSVLILCMGLMCYLGWQSFTSDEEINALKS